MTNQQDPWGKRSGDGPPDLFQLLKGLFGSRNPSSNSGAPLSPKSFKLFWLIPIGIITIWFLFGFFVVNAQEQAVITRFGRYTKTLNPGLHWIPRIIESSNVQNVQRIRIYKYQAAMLTVDTDTAVDPTHALVKSLPSLQAAKTSANKSANNMIDDQDEGANDISIVVATVTVNYRIAKPADYLFNTADPIGTLQQATSSALRQEVGHMQLEAVLSTQRELLREKLAKQLRNILAGYHTGIEVTDVTIQKTETPDEVRPAFLDVIKAQGEKNAFINMAQAYAAQQLQTAQGQSAKKIAEANAYKSQTINDAKGQVARYNALLYAYDGAPQMTRDRLYYDTMQAVLGNTTNVVLSSKGNNLIYLPLDQLLKKRAQTEAAPPLATAAHTTSSLINPSASGAIQSDAEAPLQYGRSSTGYNSAATTTTGYTMGGQS